MARSLKLDVEKTKVETSYCISQDQRERQMLLSMPRVKGRLVPREAISDEEIAIVCYGPSLRKTWREIGQFKKIMTCSGAHNFLVERKIIPTWHVDLDPREHKAKMLTPHKEVEYLIASCCHPNMIDKLEGFNVKLWHIYNNETNKDLPLTIPKGEWVVTGGCNVGLRCLVLARILGYRNFHVFGMDCSFPKDSLHHAGEHLNASKKVFEIPYDGKMYYGEAVMLDYARTFFHEMELLPDVSVKLHGEGLLQHMVAKEGTSRMKIKKQAMIAFSAPLTISNEHVEACRKLHLDPLYGREGKKYKDVVLNLSKALKTTSILDYGCGKGTLGAGLPFPIWEYDPAIPGKDSVPRSADIVVCINVLEFVEPEMLENVLGDICRCSNRVAFIVLEGKKEDWEARFEPFFKIGTILEHGKEIHCVLEPKVGFR
jgi:uncharacterized Rossmann fold enzyme